MALITCPNCNKNVSDKAEQCPHCGRNMKEDERIYNKKIHDDIVSALENANLYFEENTPGLIFIPNTKIDASIRLVSYIILIRENDMIICGKYENFAVSCENMQNLCELLARINDSYFYPILKYKFDIGAVVAEYMPNICEENSCPDLFANELLGCDYHLTRCANAILSVALGLQTPEDAFNNINHE